MQNNEYMKLGETVNNLHETPDGGWLHCCNRNELNFDLVLKEPTRKSLLKLAPAFPVNRTAMSLLKLCDGTLTCQEVVSKIASEYNCDINSAKEALDPFMEKAVKLKHLELSPVKSHGTIKLTGSTEYFFPSHMSFEITSKCNFCCSYCYRNADFVSSGKHVDIVLSGEEVIQILEELSTEGVILVELTGGEPLLHPDILEIVDYCGEHFNLCALLTNGVLLTKEIAQALADAGNFLVGISLDGPNAKVVDKIACYPGAFEKICDAFRILADFKILTHAGMTVIPENAPYIEETLLLAKEQLKASQFSAATPMNIGRARGKKQNGEDLCLFFRTIRRLINEHPGFVPTISNQAKAYNEKVGNCGAGWQSYSLGPNGDIRACLANMESWSVIGNLLRQDYRELVKSPKVNFFRNLKWPTKETCGDCEEFWYCAQCAIRGIQTALERKPDCKWAKTFNVWDWISHDANEENLSACRGAYQRK